MRIMGLVKSGVFLVSKHKSAIIGGMAIVSAFGTVAYTVKATVKTVRKVDEIKAQKAKLVSSDGEKPLKLTKKEAVEATWKYYIPVAVGLLTTTVCIFCAHKIDAKRIATATSALLLSEKMNKELENKTIKELGKDKLNEIKAGIFDKHDDLKKAYDKDGKIHHALSEYGPDPHVHCWFKDEVTGREFYSTKLDVERAIVEAMRDAVRSSGVITLGTLLDLYGLDGCTMGELLGWDIQNTDFNVGFFEPDIMENGAPGFLLHYTSSPIFI